MEKIVVLCLFILTYVLIIAFSNHKTWTTGGIAVVTALFLIIFGKSDYGFITALKSIKYDVIFMLAGIMLTVGVFSDSGMPNKIADKLMSKMPNAITAVITVSLLSGFISAFVDNVATLLMLAPIGFAIAKKVNVSPIPVLIAISVSSNLQGAATLIGDTTSIMLADAAGMNFFDFFFVNGKASIFWAVEIGALVTIPVLWFVFRKNKQKFEYLGDNVKVKSLVPTVILLLNMALLVCTSFVKFDILLFGKSILNGVVCMVCGVVALTVYCLTKKESPIRIFKDSFDYQTVLFLLSLFIIIGCVENVGIIKDIANFFASVGSQNVVLLYTLIVFASVLLSAFIDNIPFVATMIPLIKDMGQMGLTNLDPLWWSLALGACLGGNGTLIGASANVVVASMAAQRGRAISFIGFMKVAFPLMILSIVISTAYVYFRYL